MFGFKKTSELDRLRAVYADQSDGELLRLHQERDGLTDAGREALNEVMEQRGLDTSPQEEAEAAIAGPLDADVELTVDETELWTFPDTYQLQTMIGLLKESGLLFRLLDHSQQQWASLRGRRQLGITVVVPRARETEAKTLLRQVLFVRGQDQEEPDDIAFRPPRDLILLLTCERAEGLALVQALSEAGISFYWRDGREDNEVPGLDGIALEVQSAQHDQAEQVVHAWMAARAAVEEHDLDVEA